jgi:crossover junction endodeoxyribonuclease RuvC
MVVLGVDPGSRATGYGVLSFGEGGYDILSCGVIRLKASDALPERIYGVCSGLEQIIRLYRPERLAIETAFLSHNVRSALVLGQVRGAVIALAMKQKLDLHEYAPREVKRAVTGIGSASKKQVAGMLARLLNISGQPKPFDVSDALGIAFCDLLRNTAGNGAAAPLRKGRTGTKKGWNAFLAAHPELVV